MALLVTTGRPTNWAFLLLFLTIRVRLVFVGFTRRPGRNRSANSQFGKYFHKNNVSKYDNNH